MKSKKTNEMKRLSRTEEQLWNEFYELEELTSAKLSEILKTIPPYERQHVWHELNRRQHFVQQISAMLKRLADE